jgi:uncharacterized protein YjbJ (UPF0337 family)
MPSVVSAAALKCWLADGYLLKEGAQAEADALRTKEEPDNSEFTRKSMMEILMDWSHVEGNWKQVKGKVKEKWGKLTDDDLTAINGRREQLEAKIQESYGCANDQARKEIDDWYGSQSRFDWPDLPENLWGSGKEGN